MNQQRNINSSISQQYNQQLIVISIITTAAVVTSSIYYMFTTTKKSRQQQSSIKRSTSSSIFRSNNNTSHYDKQQQQQQQNQSNNDSNDNDNELLLQRGVIGIRGYRIANNIGPNVMAPPTVPQGVSSTNTNTKSTVSVSYNTINPMSIYIDKFFIALQDQCIINHSSTTNTNNNTSSDQQSRNNTTNTNNTTNNNGGYIILCVAENKLCTELVSDRLNQAGTSECAFTELYTYNYNSFLGIPMARDAAAYFLAKRFYKTTKSDQYKQQNQLQIQQKQNQQNQQMQQNQNQLYEQQYQQSEEQQQQHSNQIQQQQQQQQSSNQPSQSNQNVPSSMLRRSSRIFPTSTNNVSMTIIPESSATIIVPSNSSINNNNRSFTNMNVHYDNTNTTEHNINDESSLGSISRSSSYDNTSTTVHQHQHQHQSTYTSNQQQHHHDDNNTHSTSMLMDGAGMLEEHMTIDSKYVVIGSGASPLLSNVFFALGNGNNNNSSTHLDTTTTKQNRKSQQQQQLIDCCLIPTPYYANFDNDMYSIAGIVPYPIYNIQNVLIGPTPIELDSVYNQAKANGYNPRFILLCNPNNPLGIIYPSSSIVSIIQWARSKSYLSYLNTSNNTSNTTTNTKSFSKKSTNNNNDNSNLVIHVIVDEIYALTIHPTTSVEFQSVIQILDNQLNIDVHMIWALSKDFGASGLRYGILYTQNELLIKVLGNINIMSSVSQPIQYMISEILTDDIFIDQYLYTSIQRTVYSCYDICCTKLNEMVIPYIKPHAAIYVYADFSSLLPILSSFEAERQLTDLFFDAKIVLTPGESQRETKPGMYRICYAWVSPDVLMTGMERLSRLVAKLRRMDWDDIVNNEPVRQRTIRYVLGIMDDNSTTCSTSGSTTNSTTKFPN